jgi:hypothetical protein
MAGAAEEAVIVQAALAAAVGDGEDMVRLPARPCCAPGATFPARGFRGPPAAPRRLCLFDIERTAPADPRITLPDLFPHVARAAPQPPLVDARVAAEGAAARGRDNALAPAADWLACGVAVGLAPVVPINGATPNGAHAPVFRPIEGVAVGPRTEPLVCVTCFRGQTPAGRLHTVTRGVCSALPGSDPGRRFTHSAGGAGTAITHRTRSTRIARANRSTAPRR